MKHAYLIIAHKEPDQLMTLVSYLDHEDNDIFIHLDKRVPIKEFTGVAEACNKSKCIFIEQRCHVSWGGQNQIKAELLLYEYALQAGSYDFFHLMSGCCMPIKPIGFINTFFEENKGKEFIGFFNRDANSISSRIKYRYYFQSGFLCDSFPQVAGILQSVLVRLQRTLHIIRNCGMEPKKGPNWCTLTKEAVKYLINSKKLITKYFYHGFCADEIYKQTILWDSPFRNKIYNQNFLPEGNLYLTIWQGGAHPYVFKPTDEDTILKSNMLYARKFDLYTINKMKKLFTKNVEFGSRSINALNETKQI